MKTSQSILLLGAVICLSTLFASCDKNNDVPQTDNAVRFSATIAAQQAVGSRASGASWTNGDAVGVRMVNASNVVMNGYTNVKYTTDAAGKFSETGTTMYYPAGKVGFIAYYPYTASLSGDSYSVNVANQSNPPAIDLLYAKTTVAYDKASTSVPLQFSHKLSKLVIKTVAGTGVGSLAGTTVSIKGMNTAATFNLLNGTLGAGSTPTAIVPKTITDGQQYEAIILPATFVANTVTVDFSLVGNIFTWNVPATEFQSAKSHTWIITLSATGVTGIQSSITDWISGTGGSETITNN